MSRPIPAPIRTLSPRNLDVLHDIARFKFLTTEHVRELHFRHVGTKSEAPRMLLSRLRRQGLIERQLSFARSTQAADGLTVTKPRPVWMMPQTCRNELREHLTRAGNKSGMDRFEACPLANHSKSFSEQGLAHEIGITTLLMGFEQAARTKPSLGELKWLRTSPRHELTSHSVEFRVRGRLQKGHINPDAVVYLTMTHAGQIYPFLFFLEYERGTATPQQYLQKKLMAYAALAQQMRTAKKSYRILLERLNEGMGLKLARPPSLPFRVLTVARSDLEAVDLLCSASSLNDPKLFNFGELASASRTPLESVWMRNLEYSVSNGEGKSWQGWYELNPNHAPRQIERRKLIAEKMQRIALP